MGAPPISIEEEKMIGSSSFMDDLEILSRILIRCFVIGVVFITFWFTFFLLGGNAGYLIHTTLFQISRHEYDLMNYYGMAFVKGCNFLFFLFPYMAIRMVLRRRNT
jgi:hypothetical protein